MRRKRALQAANYQCSKCPSKRGLEVHHRTYERLGREWDQDLAVLCDDCHIGEHETLAEGTSLELFLKLTRQALAADPFISFADLKSDVLALCATHKVPRNHALIEKALALVLARQALAPKRSRRAIVQAPTTEPLSYAPPCSCDLCVAAGVSDQRLRRVSPDSEWLHGEDLKRWYAARDVFTARARGAVGARGRHSGGFERLVGHQAESPKAPPKIDIYAPVYVPGVEHDRY